MNEKLKGCMINNGSMAQRVHEHMNESRVVDRICDITVYGVLDTRCVEGWIAMSCDKDCQMTKSRWNSSKACYREECGESGLRTATSPQTLRTKNSHEDMAM